MAVVLVALRVMVIIFILVPCTESTSCAIEGQIVNGLQCVGWNEGIPGWKLKMEGGVTATFNAATFNATARMKEFQDTILIERVGSELR